ncbi:hypothetical protein MTR67_027873 [Solanum verrucosum]|uniref:Reverse transcriptase zinc-binding domain-containing protein n=1 Tax=Solanum verrucosum TaxID=315347 RepID=A0AAF0R5I9_SOLVR|nr:hypothetical protein MTR67_027873 [Solanum verrucosum]
MGHWTTKPMTSTYGVGNWKSIRNLWEVFIANTRVRLGNGKKISVWRDDWLGNGPLIDQFHDLFILSSFPDATVEELWTPQGWNIVFRRLLNDWEIPRVTDLFGKLEGFSGLKEEEDSLTWIAGTKAVFSVKTTYNYLMDLEQFNDPWPWKEIWKARAPFKEKFVTKSGGRLFQLAYGGQFGKRGMQDVLKAGAVQSRRSRAPAFLFTIFGVKKS